jgi:hypothetical protein
MRKAHFVLQGKGGVGKTFVASLVAQYLTERGEPVACLDTDQVNGSFQDIAALGARPVKILKEDSEEIDIAEMDGMVERILTEDKHFVVDNGATSFVPMSRYLVQDGVVQVIRDAGKQVVIHTIVAGGPELVHTGRGFHAVVRQFPPEVESCYGSTSITERSAAPTARDLRTRRSIRGAAPVDLYRPAAAA